MKKKQFSSVPVTSKPLSTSLNNFENPELENMYGNGESANFKEYLNCSGKYHRKKNTK